MKRGVDGGGCPLIEVMMCAAMSRSLTFRFWEVARRMSKASSAAPMQPGHSLADALLRRGLAGRVLQVVATAASTVALG